MFKKYILFNKIFNLNKIHNHDYANHDYVKYLCIYILIKSILLIFIKFINYKDNKRKMLKIYG